MSLAIDRLMENYVFVFVIVFVAVVAITGTMS